MANTMDVTDKAVFIPVQIIRGSSKQLLAVSRLSYVYCEDWLLGKLAL